VSTSESWGLNRHIAPWSTLALYLTVTQIITLLLIHLIVGVWLSLKNRSALLYRSTMSTWLRKATWLFTFLTHIDTKKILTALPPEVLKRLPGHPQMTWMKTVLNDLESHNLTLTEAVNMAQNRPLCGFAGCAWHYTLLVMQARNQYTFVVYF